MQSWEEYPPVSPKKEAATSWIFFLSFCSQSTKTKFSSQDINPLEDTAILLLDITEPHRTENQDAYNSN